MYHYSVSFSLLNRNLFLELQSQCSIFRQNRCVMFKKIIVVSVYVLFLKGLLFSQYSSNNSNFEIVCNNKPLSEVLLDLEKSHSARFSYSKDKLNINKKVSANIKSASIEQALKTLFKQNNIEFLVFGNQWALKNAEQPIINSVKVQSTVSQQNSVSGISSIKPENILTQSSVSEKNKSLEITSKNDKNTYLEQSILQRFRTDVRSTFKSWKSRKEKGLVDIFNFSVFNTSKEKSDNASVMSFSLGLGQQGSSEAIQLGVFGSLVKHNTTGIQAAGIFNSTGEDMKGLQISGFLNNTKGHSTGMQLSGAYNQTSSLDGLQIGAGLNIVQTEMSGVQIAGLGNVAGDASKSVQIAGLFNVSKENSMIQVAGFYNKADNVEGIQISTAMNEAERVKGVQMGAVNRAKVVKGMQLGLINFVDSIKGVSLGLINIVRAGGYNKLESGFSESLNVLFSVKMGSSSLYHIYQGGFALKARSWGLGWGLGTIVPLNKKWNLNFEMVALHINEDKVWNNTLNLMGQFRSGFEYNIDKGFGIFFGPSFNMMLSRYVDPETGLIGSHVPMYFLYDKTQHGTNLQLWIGCQTGLRMTLW
jgi:hypothetical protein